MLIFSIETYKDPNRTTMKQERLDSLSLLMIEADLLRKINLDDIIKDFARHKSRKKEPKNVNLCKL